MNMVAMNVNRFVFNSFGVNTYVLTDDTGLCLIIDPACQSKKEEIQLLEFITNNHLNPVGMINTHFHIDHVVGNSFVCNTFNIKPVCHKKCKYFWETAIEQGNVFGIFIDNIIIPTNFIDEGQIITFGNSAVQVLYTPGHADGSVCLVNQAERYVVSGDVLFRDSIGRTDLPSGDFNLLRENITQKLFTLPDDFMVFPGHGPETSIGYEKLNNPFI
jgi:hydroxyacylglutathione hydrolase